MQKKVALLTIICSGVIGVWLVITGGFRSESTTTVIQYSSGLMNPTVTSGPVQVKLLADDEKKLPRGTVVYYETTQMDQFDRPPGKYIGRIVGLEHDVVSVQEGRVFINDEQLDEPYISSLGPISQTLEPITVAKDSYFLLGDMRGVVPLPYVVVPAPRIVGRVLL